MVVWWKRIKKLKQSLLSDRNDCIILCHCNWNNCNDNSLDKKEKFDIDIDKFEDDLGM